MITLPQRITAATAREQGAITFIQGDDAERILWSDLHRDARAVAAALQARGIGPGAHVALLGPTSRRLVTAIQAVWLTGATVMVLPLPMRVGSLEEFVAQTRNRIDRGDARLVLVDDEVAAFFEPQPGDPAMVTLSELGGDAADFVEPRIDPGRLAVLQFTSGSTSEPKGVMLPHRTMCSNLDAIIEATSFDPDDDVLVSWLPLSHDMGLVGMLLLSMTTGADLALAGPQDFMAAPNRWVRWLSEYRATATAGPNFAWVLATRSLKRLDGLDLSRLRVALNGAEPVDAAQMEDLVAAGAPHGLRPGALFPAFGMAEVTIAGTFPVPMDGLRTDDVGGRVLETESYAAPADPDVPGTRRLVRLGRPVPGLEIRVVDPATGVNRREREVGELEIRGTSVTPGYYDDPAATAAAFRDGWLRTGDLAYVVDGELVVCGRIKDVIIVGGRNLFPQDIESVVAGVDGVRAGNVVAFGIEGRQGREDMVVIAEVKAESSEMRKVVSARVRDSTGISPGDVVLVAAGSLPKTSSGKLQRTLCRQKYLDEALQPV